MFSRRICAAAGQEAPVIRKTERAEGNRPVIPGSLLFRQHTHVHSDKSKCSNLQDWIAGGCPLKRQDEIPLYWQYPVLPKPLRYKKSSI